jgi:uncharacterized protein YegL
MKTLPRPRPLTTKLIAAALFAATAGLVAWLPGAGTPAVAEPPLAVSPKPPAVSPNERPIVEAVFVLDTTGSMGGLIQAAKDKIWSIASTMAAAEPAPLLRMGLVAYRDRGDAYVTRVVDLSLDLDALHAELFQLQANGGGDGPEAVNQALHEAVNAISWSRAPGAYRVIFLVGDAEPHMDYQDDVKYPQTLTLARERGIRVNAIQCGNAAAARAHWQQVAQLGGGAYFRVDQDGAAVAIATPYDDELAALATRLDATRLYYGSAEERADRERRLTESSAVLAAAPAPVKARRATFAASDTGKAALLGERELVDEVAAGRVALDDIAPAALPEPLQGLDRAEQQRVIDETAAERAALQAQIEATAAKRAAYLRNEVAARGGAEDSLDHKLFDAVREQAGALGLRYSSDAPAY